MDLKKFPKNNECNIAIIGLGYVGLPLAIEFAKSQICVRTKKTLNHHVIGFDLNIDRLNELREGIDRTKEIPTEILKKIKNITYTNNIDSLSEADVFIVTVPTPIDENKKPDLRYLKSASIDVGKALKKRLENCLREGNQTAPVVIYESTVFPGATEEICIPILIEKSGLKFNDQRAYKGFFCGYSPERVNPSDKIHTLKSITKVTSGGDNESAKWIDDLYASIIEAGTYQAPSIKVAEAAKVIENSQRDLNIALINEFSIIFKKIGIDTRDVLDTANTKWNFLRFLPGLVGGHCISVDPYYLTYKSEQLGYYPQVVLAGRKINDQMSGWVTQNLIEELNERKLLNNKTKVLILGFTFKENCVDTRNTKIIDIVNILISKSIDFEIVDPWVNKEEVFANYQLKISNEIKFDIKYSAVIAAVRHKEFLKITKENWESLITKNGILYDLKNIIPRDLNPLRL